MRSIQQLHDMAHRERQKAEDVRREAEKYHLKARDAMGDARVSSQATNDAQKYEEQAESHEQIATKYEVEATELEAKALELNRRKTEILNTSQAEIEKLDNEERALRG